MAKIFPKDGATIAASRETIRRMRNKAKQMDILIGPLTLHWDSKIVRDLNTATNVDRLATIVTGENFEQLLSIPILHLGTAERATKVILEQLNEWRITDQIAAFCFDTTSVNSGKKKAFA